MRWFIRSRYPWAFAAGLVLAAAFPKIGVAGFAWIAPALILLTAVGKPPGQTFRIGYAAGLAHYFASLYWLLRIPVAWAPILGWVALSAYLALYPATWAWLCWRFFPVKLADGESLKPAHLAERFLSVPWPTRTAWTIGGAMAWVALEMIVARFLTGFPWNLLGASQYQLLPLIQVASWTGIYGVSFLVVWSSLSLLCAGMAVLSKPATKSLYFAEIILPMTAVGLLYAAGYHKMLQPEPKRPQITAALVQPSIPQTLIWDPAGDETRFEDLIRLSRDALTNKPDILIWPEAAVPRMVRYDRPTQEAITALARENKVWLIIGSDDAEPRPHARNPEDNDYFNASFLVSPDGELMARYVKRNLVVFGEYIPLVRWLPFLKYLTPIEGGFTSGVHAVPFALAGLNINISVLICFEDVFPQLAREYVFPDTDFLVNLTNNGWFGESAAQWQHAASAVFRAVENGVPLVRCSNNGLTCWVDECGRIRQEFRTPERGIYGPGFLITRIPVLRPGETRPATFYNQHGDWFGWTCVILTAIRLGASFAQRRSAKLAA